MRVCFILPAPKDTLIYTNYFLMTWTDLVLKCAQKGHQVMVSQQPTIKECFDGASSETFDVYMCIDPTVVFNPDDVFKLLESPHDVTGSVMMSQDCRRLTCGRTMDAIVGADQYIEVESLQPSWVLLRAIPEGWDFSSPIKGHVDTTIRVGNRQVVTL